MVIKFIKHYPLMNWWCLVISLLMNWCLILSTHKLILYFDKRSIVLESSVFNLNDIFQRIYTTLFEEFNWYFEELLSEDWLNNFQKTHWMKFEKKTHFKLILILKLMKFGGKNHLSQNFVKNWLMSKRERLMNHFWC